MVNAFRHSSLVPKQAIEWLLLIVFILAPLFYSENLGGSGLDLPFNITVWAMATLVIAYSIWYLCNQSKLILPSNYKSLLALPLGILLAATFAGVHDPIAWLFRVLYVLAGVLFLFGLFQFRLKNTDRVLLLIAVATLLHSSIGLIQLFQLNLLADWIPKPAKAEPIGIFQQINVLASFLVTGLLVAFYLYLRPIAYQRTYLKIFLLIVISLGTFVVVASGSRVGLLSGAIGLSLLLLSYSKQLHQKWRMIAIALSAILVASFLAQGGLHKTLDKSYRIVEAQYSDQRMSIYRISVNVIAEEPIFGHGIGTFVEKWGAASATFAKANPNAELPQFITHPHNELLLWGIEGGGIALLGIMIALLSVIMLVARTKYSRVLGYLALLVPISMHSLVELPFYTSSIHWFVWLFLLFLMLNMNFLEKRVLLSSKMQLTIKSLIGLSLPLILLFLFTTYQSQKGINDFARKKSSDEALEHGLNNPYFKTKAERLLINAFLADAIEKNNDEGVLQALSLLHKQTELRLEPQLFEALTLGYDFLNLPEERCSSLKQGINIFPANRKLLALYQKCEL